MAKELVEAVDLFPIRVKPKLVKATAVGGDNQVNRYDPATKEAVIPVGDNAYERTVRLHESLHAIYSSGRVADTVVAQTAEDLRLHLNKAQLEGQPRRDEITAAVLDLRSIASQSSRSWKMKEFDDELLGVFLRSVAILQGHSGWTPSSKATRYSKLIKRAYSKVRCKRKAKLGQSLKRAFEHIRKRDSIADAVKVLSQHFLEPEAPPQGGRSQKNGYGGESSEGQGINNPFIQLTKGDGDSWMSGWGDQEFAKIKLPPDLKFVADDKVKKRLLEFSRDGLIPTVRIHRLALTHPKKSDKGPITVMTFSGAKIRAKRLAAAMTSPIPVRLFKRRRINTKGGVGGTILIDASGSMGIEDEALDELMELCPMGSIAYYHGSAEGTDVASARAGGDVVVVAERGKQCDLKNIPIGQKGRPERKGYNLIDLQAMQWMMTHPKPWYYLTDGQFTGACAGIAQDLLMKLLDRKVVQRVTSIKSMKAILGKLNEELESTNK